MVPDKFNMVDMDGIDLIMMQGEEVPGLYDRLVESIAQCRYQCLYNWFFDGVVIPPTYVRLEVNEDDEVAINEGVTVSQDDIIHIYSLAPPTPEPEIIPLLAEENGVYNVPVGKDGFNPVTVNVPSYTPVINPISITENGIYNAPSGVDGYSPITVDVSGGISANMCEIFRHIMFSNSANDCVARGDRYFQRNSDEPILFLPSAYISDNSLAYIGYAGISFSSSGITGTYSSYGNLGNVAEKVTPRGTAYYVQVMNGMYPPNVDSGVIQFRYDRTSTNYTFRYIPNLSYILIIGDSKDAAGNQTLINNLYSLIDAIYDEYYNI